MTDDTDTTVELSLPVALVRGVLAVIIAFTLGVCIVWHAVAWWVQP